MNTTKEYMSNFEPLLKKLKYKKLTRLKANCLPRDSKITEKTILFFKILFWSNLTLFSKIFTLVVLILSTSKSLFVAILLLNNDVS